ncbi:DUF4340 domain-containing protein [Paraglaciecola sp. MB-3u-78]|jgi:hypothetical protein|uniref:DUF4340 domain-containing protein n=1 Tax=Paraglaciecola sp. MB-3u-78 TaxID=2058332 RepID=UPI000C324169|nr:DUF4340 domain-containing protein [Paraglaciecola sp. MB-3u-78]PKH00616.1 hypothetical protein CXF95_03640 [Paraglaciecola sp. MB-3u-78]
MNKQVSVLAIFAILALGLGVWLSQSPSKDKFEAVLLFDDLQELANQVDNVEIRNAQGVLFSAKKLGDRWLATFDPEQPVYPISQDKLAEFVETMMRVKLMEAKTSKPENYIRLGLQSVDVDDSMSSLVTLKTSENSWQVLVGNSVTLGEGQYILKPGDPRSWRTDKTIHLPIDKYSWLKQPILPYQAQDISSVSRVDSSDWQITRAVSGDFQLINMPKDKQLEYPSILNSIVSSLTSLDFEQLLPADEVFNQPSKILTQLEVSTAEQKIFQVVVSELEDKHFVNFISTAQTEYWQKWTYQVSNFSAQQLIKTIDDFLEQENTITNNSDTISQTIDEGDSPN